MLWQVEAHAEAVATAQKACALASKAKDQALLIARALGALAQRGDLGQP
jgi:hypothetical protein